MQYLMMPTPNPANQMMMGAPGMSPMAMPMANPMANPMAMPMPMPMGGQMSMTPMPMPMQMPMTAAGQQPMPVAPSNQQHMQQPPVAAGGQQMTAATPAQQAPLRPLRYIGMRDGQPIFQLLHTDKPEHNVKTTPTGELMYTTKHGMMALPYVQLPCQAPTWM